MKLFGSLSAVVITPGILLMVMDWLTFSEESAMTAAGIAAVAVGGFLSIIAFIRREHSALKYFTLAVTLGTFAVVAAVQPQPFMHLAAWLERLA